MAKALLCPNCRTRYAVGELGSEPTFRCAKCGQIVKVPRPRRSKVENNGGGTAVLGASATPQAPPAARQQLPGKTKEKAPKRRRERAPRPKASGHVPWPLRVLAWIVAIPVGAVVVVYPARRFGLLTGVDLADVIIGTGTGRYARLALVVVLWALASAILVQLFLVGGRALADRRRGRPADPGRPEPPAPRPRARKRAAEAANALPPAPAVAANTARSSQRLRNTAGRRTGS